VVIAGHHFRLQEGPLFLVRIIRSAADEYIISFKIHHVICDSWTIEILMNDLIEAFKAIIKGNEPHLPRLAYQYKEYLALDNYDRNLNRENDRKYWSSLYNRLSPDLTLPGIV
jgi:iturin family lipopeptide synthetase A